LERLKPLGIVARSEFDVLEKDAIAAKGAVGTKLCND